MYIYDREPSGQSRKRQGHALLRPSQVYHYPQLAQVESRSLEIGSFLSGFGESKTLAEKLRDEFRANKDKQKILKMLREQTAPFTLDTALRTELKTIFASNADELWLAETLAEFGPEPLWPLDRLKDRAKHATNFVTDPGNYKAKLRDSKKPKFSSKCKDQLNDAELPEAFFFPGRSERRALIISGVHGDEKRGVDVVKKLHSLLAASGKKPFFTTILVPVVIPRTQAGAGSRNVPGGVGRDKQGDPKCRKIEPNRNFPLPGHSLADALKNGEGGRDEPELKIQTAFGLRAPQDNGENPSFFVTSIRMLPETRILIDLIERFQPERLATVHDHSIQRTCHPCTGGTVTKCGGEGPGLFMDPRGINPANKTQLDQDDLLAKTMVEEAFKRIPCDVALTALAGNQAFFPMTVRYFSLAKVEGNSLGDWAPVPTSGRPGIATMTIEVPKYKPAQASAEKVVKDVYPVLLQEIFLELPLDSTFGGMKFRL